MAAPPLSSLTSARCVTSAGCLTSAGSLTSPASPRSGERQSTVGATGSKRVRVGGPARMLPSALAPAGVARQAR